MKHWPYLLTDWYQAHAVSYPWRVSPTPYHVWLSEIMLQQTRLETVRPYYERFISALPDIASLAAAPEEEVLKLWEGLGYYSRARHLHQAARKVVSEYGGELPPDPGLIRALPGVGDYTAGAICAIAFGLPVPAVDGNVMRVISRLYELEEDVLSPAARRRVTELVEKVYPQGEGQASAFVQGLMELGETLCLPREPRCGSCPLRDFCLARLHGRTAELPLRTARTQKKEETRTLLYIEEDGRLLLHRRPAKGVLAGLWELPAEEDGLLSAERGEKLAQTAHVFTHLIWNMTLFRAVLREPVSEKDGFRFVSPEELSGKLMLPTAFSKLLALLPPDDRQNP